MLRAFRAKVWIIYIYYSFTQPAVDWEQRPVKWILQQVDIGLVKAITNANIVNILIVSGQYGYLR